MLPPYVNIDGITVQINHAFAGIAASANTPSILAPFKTYAFTTFGDEYQVFMGKARLWVEYNVKGTYMKVSSFTSKDAEAVYKLQQSYARPEDYDKYTKIAESLNPIEQQRGNIIGRNIAPQVRGKNSEEIINLFKEEFDKIKQEQKNNKNR